ncbi:MAG: Eco57I restriction-modification methylase domain-containing protein [Thermoguttaceae bacterium]
MAKSPEELAHLQWLGYVQPLGLVVSVPAMVQAQCYINKNISGEHGRFLSCLPRDSKEEIIPEIRDLAEFTRKVLGWNAEDLKEVPQRTVLPSGMESLEVILPQYQETLRPTYVVPEFQPTNNQQLTTNNYLMLVQELPTGTELDEPGEADSGRHWNAAPQAKFERLLRETQVPIGLVSNGRQLRLVYAPRGETSGHATFNVAEMIQVAGRPMFAALQMLLCSDRMFSLGDNQRLPAILESSRKYQNTVSTKLAEQVLAALYELVRGFQAADDVARGVLLADVLAKEPNQVYSGLLTVLMRLVFVLYAEERGLLSSDPVYTNHYSVTGLFDRLRSDAGRFPDTMDQRFGAWSQLVTLFRLVYEGGHHKDFKLPARKGYLFDPDRYPFLEGRPRQSRDRDFSSIPRIPDGVVFRVLRNLLILDGERLSYRSLAVQDIGSVYEAIMGFNLEIARGKSIAVKPTKSHGAPTTINLEELLAAKGKDRAKWLKDASEQSITGQAATQLKDATTIEGLLEALDKKIAKKVTPRIVQKGAMVLQPSDERRRSGSHYTPRSLTEPIVRTTLEPLLKAMVDRETELPAIYVPTAEDKRRYTKGELDLRIRLSEKAIEAAKAARQIGTPHPAQILDLKICDPAMGSGAFLVEACWQLGEELVAAWHAHDCLPTDIPPDEDELLYARRVIAQRCLYGVDKNPMAVDLAKLSLWLATLAREHPFTFLDHSLRHGDSLVGLSRRQIIGFHWEPGQQKQFGTDLIQKRLERATEARAKILAAREDVPYRDQEQRLAAADEALDVVRITGDACVSAFFAGTKRKQREDKCEELFAQVSEWYASGHDLSKRAPVATAAAELQKVEPPVPPFHWEIEFPETFARDNGGFDAFVGNPPFLGGSKIWPSFGESYRDFIQLREASSGRAVDLIAHFFRATFDLLRRGGTAGLIATNTVAQGDTREAGLEWICTHDGHIYCANKRFKWPGLAAVTVSVVHLSKHTVPGERVLNGRRVDMITAFLFHSGGHSSPARLAANRQKSFNGSKIYGQGFLFADDDDECTPLSEMEKLVETNPRTQERIHEYIGGEEITTHPSQSPHRFVINFEDLPLEEAERWPDLLAIVREKVKPQRDTLGGYSVADGRRERWWQFGTYAIGLAKAISPLSRCLVISQISSRHGLSFQPCGRVFSHALIAFAISEWYGFAVLQSRAHELWARFFGSSMEDRLRYTPSECFETFPFPARGNNDRLSSSGKAYFDFRANLMITNAEGLTKTYNRFHDPHEKSSEILHLRELHEAMDRAVLEAYGWDDLAAAARCEFLLDYEEEGDEEPGTKMSKRKKPWRLRWPDEFRDEVLARLLELNERRHREEQLAGKKVSKAAPKEEPVTSKKPAKPRREATPKTSDLFQQETDRYRSYVLLLLRAWGGKPLTRRALNAGMILMLDDGLRNALLDNSPKVPRRRKSDLEINHILTELSTDEYVQIDSTGVQQIVRVTPAAPSTDEVPKEDVDRITAVKEYFRREAAYGKVTETEEAVDAEPSLVPTR